MPWRRRSSVILIAVVILAMGSRASVIARGTQRGAAAATVTFNRDVAPIVREQCAACHRPQGAAPFPLLTYSQVRSRATLIARVTKSRYMPPWKPRPDHGTFAGARRLTSGQIDIIQRWVRHGAPEGESADGRSSASVWHEWELGTPDLLLQMAEPFVLPAAGGDVFRSFVIPVPAARGRYVRALEFHPGTAAVHHANIKIAPSASVRRLDAEDPLPGFDGSARDAVFPDGHFLGWTPGQRPYASPDDAWLLPRGADLVVELHLAPTGKAESVQASVGLYFADRPGSRTPYMIRLGSQRIDIPAGEAAYVSTDHYVLPVDVDVVAVQPHAHNLARTVQGFARRPDGRLEWLIDIPDWDFRWQDVYRYQQPLRLPRGTTLEMKYTYDNSSRNPRNPNRLPRRVAFGQTSSSEMGDLWVQVVTVNPADRRTLDADYAPKMLREDTVGDETMLAANPRDARLRVDLGSCYMAAGRVGDAIAQLEEAVRLEPRSAAAHYELGTILLKQKQLDTAAQHFRHALDVNPALSESQNSLGVIHFLRGEIGQAIDAYRKALQQREDNWEARYNLARALAVGKRLDEAIDQYRLAATLKSDDGDIHAGMAAALALRGDVRAAVDEYRETLRLEPDLVGALTDLAWILATAEDPGLRRPEEAVRLAERAARLTNFGNGVVLDTLGASYFAAGRTEDAVWTTEQALDLAAVAHDQPTIDHLRLRLRSYGREP